jgi:hypothetical protein
VARARYENTRVPYKMVEVLRKKCNLSCLENMLQLRMQRKESCRMSIDMMKRPLLAIPPFFTLN